LQGRSKQVLDAKPKLKRRGRVDGLRHVEAQRRPLKHAEPDHVKLQAAPERGPFCLGGQPTATASRDIYKSLPLRKAVSSNLPLVPATQAGVALADSRPDLKI
jgi:hypothetical protein